MSRKFPRFAQVLAALPFIGAGLFSLGSTAIAHAQATPRITAEAERSALVSLPGAVHPWARPEFDRGPAPANLTGRMVLVLKRSEEQESALHALLASQQDPKSPNYHKWLTPEDFSKRFGVADSDVQAVTSYLSSQGMSVGRVYGGHMAIEVGASAGQIRSAFQTEIHAYSVAGKTFYSNNSAPKIPSALRTVVSGFSALNNFRLEGGSGQGRQGTFNPATHTITPLFTTTDTSSNTIYGVSPADLGVIYDIPAATAQGLGGKNVSVGVIGDSDININYVNNYRTIFGLGTNPPVVVVDGNDPGVNDDAYIAYKQIELIAAVAPNATIYYYTSATTDYDTGFYFALLRAVGDNQVQVLVNGFQQCEKAIGSGAMELVNDVSEQAAAQGMTFVAASGNSGAAGCEVPGTTGSATTGFAVNGYASSPYVTAVGGTDFFYGSTAMTTYWNATNTGYKSAVKYIPEQVWNDSYVPGGTGNSDSNQGPIVELASGGGPSTAGLDGVSTANPIPSYQSGNSKAAAIGGTARVIPDISFFAGSGANNSEGYNNTAYLFCMKYSDCLSSGAVQFTYSGGTEAASAVFAGAVALAVEQYNSGSRFGLGNVNPALYSQISALTIISHDITRGTNELVCTGSTNCTRGVMTGWKTQTGYDAATGLGSLDIGSFVTNYKPSNTTASSVTLTVTDDKNVALPSCVVGGVTEPHCTTHSNLLKFVVAASSSSGTPTGDVGIFASSPLADSAVEQLTLSSGTASDTWNLLPGGTYNLYARYAGDATYAPSVTATPYSITVQPEACQMVVYGHPNNLQLGTTITLPYGSPAIVTVEPYSATWTGNVGIPSGSIQVKDNSALITTLPLNSEGAATFSSNLLAFGSHSINLKYLGDASFSSCSKGPFVANVTKAATTTTLNAPETDTGSSKGSGLLGTTTLGITAVVQSATLPSNGTSPTGTVTFSTAIPKIAPLISGFDPNGNAVATASIVVGQADIPTSGNISATYNPAVTEVNYTGSTSNAVGFTATNARANSGTTTTFTITDNYGTYPTTGTYPNLSTPSFPVLDSITLNMTVVANQPANSVFLVYANGVLLTPATWSGGYLVGGGITPDPDTGKASFTIPQQNGYMALPSGQVQFTVLYDGWIASNGSQQADPSSANQIVTIVDDRTSADFSLQSDTTVNQGSPLLASSSTPTATYNLRLTSIYNFQSAYAATPINLSCKLVGYSLAGIRSAPAGLTCGFGSLSTSTASVTLGGSGFATKTLVVGAASGYSIASNTVPVQPATRWWMAGGGATLACIFLLGLPARRRKWQTLLGACVMVMVSFGMSGCGAAVASGPGQQYYNSINGGTAGSPLGTGTPVPAGTYTVLVTATTTVAGSTLSHTLPIQVLVGTTN